MMVFTAGAPFPLTEVSIKALLAANNYMFLYPVSQKCMCYKMEYASDNQKAGEFFVFCKFFF